MAFVDVGGGLVFLIVFAYVFAAGVSADDTHSSLAAIFPASMLLFVLVGLFAVSRAVGCGGVVVGGCVHTGHAPA